MASNPYRNPANPADAPRAESSAPREVAWAGVLLWLATAVRVGAGLLRVEASRELDLAWVVLLVVPLIVWKELSVDRQPRA